MDDDVVGRVLDGLAFEKIAQIQLINANLEICNPVGMANLGIFAKPAEGIRTTAARHRVAAAFAAVDVGGCAANVSVGGVGGGVEVVTCV